MIDISLKNIEKSYGVNLILKNISFDVQQGEKMAIIGENGSGKTTIFKIISGIEPYDKGIMSIKKNISIGYLDQIPNYPDNFKAINVINTAFDELNKISERMRNLEKDMSTTKGDDLSKLMDEYGKLQTVFEHKGGYNIEKQIDKICSGLQISNEMKNRAFNTLSGGEATIIMLAKILLQNPDLLLLDEPTNNLDIDALEWFEDYIKEYQGTIIIISHDRYFLDRIITKIIEIENGEAEVYLGNYSYYSEEKERKLLAQFEAYKNQEKKIKAMEEAIKRFKEWGAMSDNPKMFKRARNMEKKIERMEKVDKPILEKKKIDLSFSANNRPGKDVFIIENLTKSFNGKLILNKVDFYIGFRERVALIGANGSGKSTLIKILLNQIEIDSGIVKSGSNLKVGYLEQNVNFAGVKSTILQLFIEHNSIPENKARAILSKFLFFGEDVFKIVCNLSGGEMVRLKLCLLMHQDINLLILDEPTNHLDIDSKEMLEFALSEFKGTILFISHDRYFINKIANRIIEIRNKKLHNYIGNYDSYREKKAFLIKDKAKSEIKIDKSEYKEAKNKIKSEKSFDKMLLKIEEDIDKLEKLISEKDSEIYFTSNNEKTASDYKKLTSLINEKSSLQEQLDTLIKKWMILNEQNRNNLINEIN